MIGLLSECGYRGNEALSLPVPDTGPTVEPVLTNGHLPSSGNGHHDEAAEI